MGRDLRYNFSNKKFSWDDADDNSVEYGLPPFYLDRGGIPLPGGANYTYAEACDEMQELLDDIRKDPSDASSPKALAVWAMILSEFPNDMKYVYVDYS